MALREITKLTDDQATQLHAIFQNEWWTRGRRLEEVRRMIEHSDYLFGSCDGESGRLVGFARVLTDRVFKAFIFDLIVVPEHRGRGLGEALMRRILDHPDLSAVRHFELYCLPETAPLYERLGFSAEVGGILLMRRVAIAPA